MQASIQLIIVTAGLSLIDFFKALLAETGTKKEKTKKVNTQTNKQTNEACLAKSHLISYEGHNGQSVIATFTKLAT